MFQLQVSHSIYLSKLNLESRNGESACTDIYLQERQLFLSSNEYSLIHQYSQGLNCTKAGKGLLLPLSSSIHSTAIVQNWAERAQHCEGKKRADVERIEDRGNYVPEQVQIGIAEVPNRWKRLPFPRYIREPA